MSAEQKKGVFLFVEKRLVYYLIKNRPFKTK